MYTIEIAPKAEKQISKLEEADKLAIKNYLLDKVSTAKDKKDLYNIGGTELVGNLKGLWRFKDSSFKKYRIIGYLEDEKLYVIVLSVEGRADSYKNKEKMARRARKGEFKN